MSDDIIGPCPEGCLLPAGHGWEERQPDGTLVRNHLLYRSPEGLILTLQGETWSPLIMDSMLSDPFVRFSEDAPGEFSTVGAGAFAHAAATAARICRVADRRWSA